MSNHTTVTLDPGERRVYSGGNVMENILFDCTADDCALRISPSGDDWTMRNIGVKGTFSVGSGINTYLNTGQGFGELMGNDEASSGNTITIENCYFGDGCEPGVDLSFMTSSGSHGGHMVIRNSYIAGWNTSAVYVAGSARSDEARGTYEIRDCYFHDNNIASVRVAQDGSIVEGCVFFNTNNVPWATFFGPLDDGIDATQVNARAIWSSYGSPDQVVDVVDCEIDHNSGDVCPPEYGWPSSSEQIDCTASSVVGSGGDSSFHVQGGNCVPGPSGNVTTSNVGSNPDLTPPPGVPMSPEEAAGGEVIPTDTLTVSDTSEDGAEYELIFEGEHADTGPNANTSPSDPLRDSVTDNGDGTYTIHGHVANLTDDFFVHEDGDFTSIDAPDSVEFAFNGDSISRSELLGGAAPPSTSQNVSPSAISPTEIEVTWETPSDGTVGNYRIYVDGEQVEQLGSSARSTTVGDLEPDTTYSVGVSAVGPTGTESDVVSETATTQPADFITRPLSVETTSVDAFSIGLSWNAPDSVGPGLDFYTVYVNGVQDGTATGETYSIEGLDPDTAYEIEVTATDTEGDESDPSSITASTNNDGIVSSPSSLQVTNVEADRIDVAWEIPEQTGEGGIAYYSVFLDGEHLDDVEALQYTFAGLTPEVGGYVIDVTATDEGGHESPAASVTATPSGDSDLGPSDVRNLAATTITGTSVTVSFDPPENVGSAPLSHYQVYVDGDADHTLDAGSTEFSVHGLDTETTYELGVEVYNEDTHDEDGPSWDAGDQISSGISTISVTTTDGSVGGTPVDPNDPGCGFGNIQ